MSLPKTCLCLLGPLAVLLFPLPYQPCGTHRLSLHGILYWLVSTLPPFSHPSYFPYASHITTVVYPSIVCDKNRVFLGYEWLQNLLPRTSIPRLARARLVKAGRV